jgi:histidyl-tRNA synthetase
MKIPPVKGTRDLYPERFAPIRRIFDAWRSASIRHGFEEFEGPTLEMLDLYREKSGDELVGQLYRLTDSGGRELALRPEMTPTLARMVAARINALSRPIKWFCMPKLFRGENVQRGRLREFFQWNVDVIGTADMVADAECILVGVEALRDLGLTEKDFRVHISNRRLIASLLTGAGIAETDHAGAYALMDKVAMVEGDVICKQWNRRFGKQIDFADLYDLLSVADLDTLRGTLAGGDSDIRPSANLDAAIAETEQLFTVLRHFGIIEYCELDLEIIRGLAYYTGPVFEFHDRSNANRAICGGGRYDDLLGKLGKSPEPAVGFGMGDVVLSLMLEERGLLDAPQTRNAVFVADAVDGLRPKLLGVVAALRRAGYQTEFNYVRQGLSKQLKTADRKGCVYAVILGDETLGRGVVQIKDMTGGQHREAAMDALIESPREVLEARP